MGTSKRWSGPTGGSWTAARTKLTRLSQDLADALPDGALNDPPVNNQISTRIDDATALAGEDLRRALTELLATDPDALGLRTTINQCAERLVDVLDALKSHGIGALGPLNSTSATEREEDFITAFADQVAGPGGLVTEAAARRAAVRCAERLLEDDSPLAQSVRNGDGRSTISGDLFCTVYALFFAHAVSGFLTAAVAEKIKVMLPVLYLDPTGQLARWIATKIVGLIPDPCAEQEKLVDEVRPLADTARGLIPVAVTNALGLAPPQQKAA